MDTVGAAHLSRDTDVAIVAPLKYGFFKKVREKLDSFHALHVHVQSQIVIGLTNNKTEPWPLGCHTSSLTTELQYKTNV